MSLSTWGRTIRKVELFFKRIITTGSCLCPLDSYILGEAPWPCIVCTDIRRRLRGETLPRNCIMTGGKRLNNRGANTAWMMPMRVRCGECQQKKWQYPNPLSMLSTAFLIFRRRRLIKEVGRKLEVTPVGAMTRKDGVTGIVMRVEDKDSGKTVDYPVVHRDIRFHVRDGGGLEASFSDKLVKYFS